MKLITKEKLIKHILNDCIDFKKVVDYLFTSEMDLVINKRVVCAYNLNYTMTTETQLFLIDLINGFVGFHESMDKRGLRELEKNLRKLIK